MKRARSNTNSFNHGSFLCCLFFLTLAANSSALGNNSSGSNQTEFYVNQLYGQSGLKEKDKISELPGQPGKVNFAQYGGYVTVNKEAGRSLFYYFIEADGINKDSAPLLIWLNGGPGCSSLFGAMQEIGPFRVQSDGKTLHQNPFAWNKVANILFIESPAGTGFSYSNNTDDYETSGDERTAEDAYIFVLNWLERFPEYKNRDLYLSGESYAGHYVPQLAMVITQHTNKNSFVNLKGIAIGNPFIDESVAQSKGYFDYLFMRSLIPDFAYDKVKQNCNFEEGQFSNLCRTAIQEAENIAELVTFSSATDSYNIYAHVCPESAKVTDKPIEAPIDFVDPCFTTYLTFYFNQPEVQSALHANVTHSSESSWVVCNDRWTMSGWEDKPLTVLPVIKSLLDSGKRALLYSGDLDYQIPYTVTLDALKKLNLQITTPWNFWKAKNEVGGFYIGYEKNLTFATVRAAGHEAPLYQPERSLTLITTFIRNEPFLGFVSTGEPGEGDSTQPSLL